MSPSGGRHKAKVFFVSPFTEMWKFQIVGRITDILTTRALHMRYPLFLWAGTPYNAECGVISSLSPTRFFHNLCKDK